MIYKIKYTASSIIDLKAISDYISLELCNENVAKKIIKSIIDSIDYLSTTPFMHKIIDDDYWSKRGLRVYSIKNYTIMYIIKKTTKEVIIGRIIYSKMNINEQLKKIK